MPITFDTLAELEAFYRDFKLQESTFAPISRSKQRAGKSGSVRQQAKGVLAAFVQAGQPFTVQDCLKALQADTPTINEPGAVTTLYQLLTSDYPHLKSNSVSQPHSRRPLKQYLP
jgi:hypothetical protein